MAILNLFKAVKKSASTDETESFLKSFFGKNTNPEDVLGKNFRLNGSELAQQEAPQQNNSLKL